MFCENFVECCDCGLNFEVTDLLETFLAQMRLSSAGFSPPPQEGNYFLPVPLPPLFSSSPFSSASIVHLFFLVFTSQLF